MADRLSVEPPGRTEFGAGVVAELPTFLEPLEEQRVLVVTDRGLRASGIVSRIEQILGDVEHVVHEDVGPNPTTDEVDRGAARLREFGRAVVLAVGGGSALDAAKGIALLAANPQATATGLPGRPVDGFPLVAVPTTAGTGAETNGFGVVEDPRLRRKVYIGHPSVRPRTAVLDPELTLGLPRSTTASSGFDALVHGIESLASRGANPVSQAFATQAITMLGRSLPAAHRDGTDLDARAEVLFGAHLAGHALTLSGLGLVHGIGHALTAQAGIPHGVALAAVAQEVMAFSAAEAAHAYATTARALGVGDAIEAVAEVCAALDIRRPLRELGVDREALPGIAAGAAADAVTRNAPRLPRDAEVLELLASVH
ncbi:iron-containing alcohol dehydrogenase [Saccharopolyspora rhizosphaerae]|uniref:Iron-containing alcohol dehydrogenase n=1 Tax=Saccharopolyspora rhizosphaerae TaxID=2492662 RepID=A0A426JM35_9PSEU|nr:iron-containing alcohol dehydrogenase [Saccharopolyspora rhizosphaerae]RRO14224.1 iron-containing alcohol dehydrogenase [Saccharopolyspora rhizosphaerae]